MRFVAIFFAFIFCICSVAGTDIPEKLMEVEQLAFQMCELDGTVGLTWLEVQTCEVTYADEIAENNIPIPSEDNFIAADLNKDGTLMFDEWMEWVENEESTEETTERSG
eukprot:GFUD01071714.1.p1 GENE.GFUD01071714.1~~GFUD01071714.1.p1  ORF type:complete len:109 (-),score=31.93 GFUD01071714.1:115-441(-)